MAARVDLFSNGELDERLEVLQLSEMTMPDSGVGEGQPLQLWAKNSGDTLLRNVRIFTRGEGSPYVQMAKDMDGEPGVWAAAGEPIVAFTEMLFPGEAFPFWIKPCFAFEDMEGVYDFEFVVRGKSMGIQ